MGVQIYKFFTNVRIKFKVGKFAYFKFIVNHNLCYVKDSDQIILKKIGERLQEARLQKNLTQKELAFMVDVEISQITRIERGVINTSVLSLMRITDALEISISDFLKDLEKS